MRERAFFMLFGQLGMLFVFMCCIFLSNNWTLEIPLEVVVLKEKYVLNCGGLSTSDVSSIDRMLLLLLLLLLFFFV